MVSFKTFCILKEIDNSIRNEKQIVKQASDNLDYTPTKNLYNDLWILSQGLKANNLISQAEDLENKIFLAKQAEVHLYKVFEEEGEDLLQMAYPNGNTKIAPANDELGEVETPLSAHLKMLEVTQHQPTGKTASLLQNIADVLNVDLKKVAQTVGQDELQEGLDEVDLDENTQKKVNEINQFLKIKWPDIGQTIKKTILSAGITNEGIPGKSLNFDPSLILSNEQTNDPNSVDYLDFFASKAKADANELKNFVNQYHQLYDYAEFDANTIVRKIFSINDYDSLRKLAASIDPQLDKKYFYGSDWPQSVVDYMKESKQEDSYQDRLRNNPSLAYNKNSVWLITYDQDKKLSPEKVQVAAEEIHKLMSNRYKTLITDNLPVANQAVATEILTYLTPLSTMLNPENSVNFSNIPVVKTSTGFITSALYSFYQIISNYGTNTDTGKALWDIFSGLKISNYFFSQISNVGSKMMEIIKYLTDPQNIINPTTDQIPDKNIYLKIAENFKIAARRLNSQVKKMREANVNENSSEFKKYFNRLKKAVIAYRTISKAVNKPYGAVHEQISQLFSKVKNISDLTTESETWLKGTEPLVTKTSSQFNLHKQADYGDDEFSSTVPNKSTPAKSTSTSNKKIISPEEKEAVQSMQLSLFTLGQYVKTYGAEKIPELKNKISAIAVALMRTGPGLADKATKNQFDGNWGANTANAITTAQNVINSWNNINPKNKIANLVAGPMMGQPQSVSQAENNTNIINNLIKLVFGANVGVENKSAVYDYIADSLDEEHLSSLLGKIPVTEADLSSLSSFYNFLVERGIEQPVFDNNGNEGFPAKVWVQILNWFKERSQLKFENAQGAEKSAFLNYRRLINNLERMWNNLLSQTKINSSNESTVIPLWYLSKAKSKDKVFNNLPFGRNNQFGMPAERELETLDRESDSRISSDKNHKIQEGRSLKMPAAEDDSPPIGEILDLRKEWFNLPYQDLAYPQLRLEQFKRTPAVALAQMLFGSDSTLSDQELQAKVLTNAGISERWFRWNENRNEYEVYIDNYKKYIPLSILRKSKDFISTYPEIVNGIEDIRQRDPVDKFQKFLHKLANELHRVANQWSQSDEVSDEEIAYSSEYSKRWIQAIKRKLQQLQEWRANK